MGHTFTTIVIEKDKWIEIITRHDQSGSGVRGKVPLENIPMLIEGLKKFICVSPVVVGQVCEHRNSKVDKVRLLVVCADCGFVIAGE